MRNVRLLFTSVVCVFGFLISHAQNIIVPYAGSGFTLGDGGQATACGLNQNYMIAMDGAGNVYLADNGNNRVRKIDATTKIITTIAGIGGIGANGADGIPATNSALNSPVGVWVDGSNNVYIGDQNSHRIRKVDGTTGIISTVCGTAGTSGSSIDGTMATLALINQPRGVCVNSAGDIFFTEGGGTTTRVRKVTAATGLMTIVAGTGTAGVATDGVLGTLSMVNNPRGVSVDASGNLYIADMNNSRIRKVDGSGIITTVAGNGTAGLTGDGTAATTARINLPTDMKFDGAGNMYIADVSNGRVRMVNTSGVISTVAGNQTPGGTAGDWTLATATTVRMNAPVSVAPFPNGNYFYISDRSNNRIRYVRPDSRPYFISTRDTLTICQNVAAVSINSLLSIFDTDRVQTETWSLGPWSPLHGTPVLTGTSTATGGAITPTGKTYQPTFGYSGMDSFIVQVSDGYLTSNDTIIVIINPFPVVPALTGPNTVCEGASIVLADDSTGGSWTSSSANATVVSGTVNGITAGTADISYAITNSCATTTVVQTVTVNPLPNAGTISGSTFTVCVASFITLTDAAPGGTWSESNGNATVVGGFVTGVSVGTDDISYTVTNSCGTDNAIQTVTVNDLPVVPAITGPASVCVGSTVVLADATPGGVWTASNANATVVSGTVMGVSAGTDDISYAVTNGCGTTTVVQTQTINPLPVAGTISGPVSVCIGDNISLSVTGSGGTWTASNANATVTSGGVVTGVTVGSVVINYTVTNVCGTAVASYTINVVSIPSAGTISGPSAVCAGATVTLTDPVAGGAWTASNSNATVAGGTVTGVTAGTVVITYTIVVSCGSAFTTHAMTVNPLPAPAAITGVASVCVGSTTTLADATPGGTWSSGTPAIGTVAGGVVTGISGGVATISYSLTNGCGTVAAISNVTVNPIVAPSVTFSGLPGLNTCPGVPVTYTAAPVNGGPAPVYQWRVNGTIVGSGPSIVRTPINGQVFTVKMTSNAACVVPNVAYDTAIVVVNPTLVPSVRITTGAYGDTLCVGTVTTYTATPVNGGTAPTYQWYVNSIPTVGGNPFSYIPTGGDIVTCALTSSYACPMPATVMSNSLAMTVMVTETPSVTVTVSPANTVCAGSPVTFTAHPIYGGVPPFFRWTLNGVNVATGVNYIYSPANGDNVYCMMASSSSCRTIDTVFSNHIHMNAVSPAAIAVSITATSAFTAVGVADTLKAVVTGAVLLPTYQWYKNGTAVPGANSSTYVVIATAPGTQLMNCVVGSDDICNTSAVSNVLSLSFSNVGVQPLPAANEDLKLLPNPNKGTFTMNLESANDELVHVLITNILGEKVKEFTTSTNMVKEIRLDNAAGIYFLNATTGTKKYTAKVVVE